MLAIRVVKLLPDKGINFPDTLLNLCPLTEKDKQDLDFIVSHADIVGYSFVQNTSDIDLLEQELQTRQSKRLNPLAIVAKIETPQAICNLPELIVHAAGKYPFGVMIARGDLAVEIGYQRLAEMQEEILWLCEAAHVPVIWATQVLEKLVKKGIPSRPEMTDAAMSERAECVMLNKGRYQGEAVRILDDILRRMQEHQLKKDTPITGSLFLEILRPELISAQKPHNFLKLFVYKEGVEFKGRLSGIKQHWLLKSRIIC